MSSITQIQTIRICIKHLNLIVFHSLDMQLISL